MSEPQQCVFIAKHTRKSTRYLFYLPCLSGMVPVCKNFFKRVLHIGSRLETILKINTITVVQKESMSGKWKRDTRMFKRKILDAPWVEWLQLQPKCLSHFSRGITRQQLWYFTECTSFRELYRNYKAFSQERNIHCMSKTSFFTKFKKRFPNYKFHRPILDACSTCLHLNNLLKKATTNRDKIFILHILERHQDEADFRYKEWRKNRNKVKQPLSDHEVEVIVESKYKFLILHFISHC